MTQHRAQLRNAMTTMTRATMGGQHRPSVGDSTHHRKSPWDFSVALANMGGQHRSPQGDSTRDDPALCLCWFEQERLKYATTADRAW